jgi:hypothetical protein
MMQMDQHVDTSFQARFKLGEMEQVVDRGRAPLQSTPMERTLTAAVERSPLRHDPFDHVYMEDIFDAESYAALLTNLPDRRFYHELSHQDAIRRDGSSTRLRMYLYPELLWRLPPNQRETWMPIASALCSGHLEDALKRKFRLALENRFGKPIDRIGVYPIPILLRDQPGYRIGIHADALSKAITVQFYLPHDASQRHVGTLFHEGENGEAAERTTQMPFMPGSGYAFPVSEEKSWHSAATTTQADGERVSMMVTYYASDNLPMWLKYRLRRLGLLFGIHPKG